jgi:hypothetical protein
MLLAHNLGGGSLPAPAWLLGYIGAFAVLATALGLRTGWTEARLAAVGPQAFDEDAAWADDINGGRRSDRRGRWIVGHAIGTALLVGVIYVALAGPDQAGSNVANRAVWIAWWLPLPLVCLLVGDLVRWINPFVPVVQWVEQMRPNLPSREHLAPVWTAAASLWAFAWFFVAYQGVGAPRSAATFLLLYAAGALAGGVFWGTRWLMRGEGFAGLSVGIAGLVRPKPGRGTGALLPLAIVLVGTAAFDALSGTEWWIDVAGTTTGWGRTGVFTVGFVWLTAVVGMVVLVGIRVITSAERGEGAGDEATADSAVVRAAVTNLFGVAFLPVAIGWFLAHYLTLFLVEGVNLIALSSDPLGRGEDWFGTIDWYPTTGLITAGWIRWAQLGLLLTGHVAAVVLAHDGAIGRFGRRRGMRVTWVASAVAAVSVVSAALLVLR